MSGNDGARRRRVGIVGRPHGLDGSFHPVAVVTSVFALLDVGFEVEIADRSWRINRLGGHPGRPIVRLEGHETRDDVEPLRGQEIHLPRSATPALEEDEWWAEDLEGCSVRDGDREVGTVIALLGLPSCDVLEVRRAGESDRPELLVPLIRDAVRDVDLDAGVIDIDLAFLGEA